MKLGTNDIGSVYLGTNAVQSVYLGTNLVYSAFSSGLLDTYTGAAAAYSLRRLSIAYTGSAIKVRRSVGSPTEKDIGFVGENLDVADLESFCSGTDGFVVTWYDQSGNGNNATQTSASAQPQIVSSGSVITENGKPTVKFDGSDDYFETSLSVGTISQASYFALSKIDAAASGFKAIIEGRIANDDGIGMAYLSSTSARFHIDQDDRLLTTSGQTLLSGIYENSNSTFYENNNTSSTGIAPASISVAINYRIFNSFSLTGAFFGNSQEIIIYHSDQSTNRTGIETNINDFYSIY